MDSCDSLTLRSYVRRATENPEEVGRFGQAMTSMSRQPIAGITAHDHFSAFEHIVDVGGNRGMLLLKILEHRPGLIPASPPQRTPHRVALGNRTHRRADTGPLTKAARASLTDRRGALCE